jgi:hypothetical protein
VPTIHLILELLDTSEYGVTPEQAAEQLGYDLQTAFFEDNPHATFRVRTGLGEGLTDHEIGRRFMKGAQDAIEGNPSIMSRETWVK